MRILVKEADGSSVKIEIANALVLSPLGCIFLKKNKHTRNTPLANLKVRDLHRIRREIKRQKKLHTEWCLVDVLDSDGDHVRIYL